MSRRKEVGANVGKNKCKQLLVGKGGCWKEGEDVAKRVSADNNVLIFHPKHYPFNYQSLTQKASFKTILNHKLTKEKIDKVASLDNPSLVQILKIGKGYQKGSPFIQDQLSYSFYYQPVPYSLQKMALLLDYSNPIMAKLLTVNLKKVLAKLSDYLCTLGVGYCFNLDDMGVTKNGDIKIYVSPLVICEPNVKIDNRMIKRSINKIVSWWEITISSNQSKALMPTRVDLGELDQQNADYIDQEMSQLIEEDESDSEHTVERQLVKKDLGMINNSYRLKSSNNSYRGQTQKINQIDKQIKQIRSKLIQKAKVYRSKQKVKNYKSISESQRFQSTAIMDRQRLNESQGIGEKMHQNINCINIYTQSKEKAAPNKVKRMATQPIFSYKISPQRQQPNYSKWFPQFDYYCDSEEGQSADTYQMEIQYQKQSDLLLQKSGSFLVKNEQQQFNDSLGYKNQFLNRYTTGSAGPLQFKAILNSVINPTINIKAPIPNKANQVQSANRKRSQSLVDNNESKMMQKTKRLSNLSSINQFNRLKSLKKDQKVSQTITPRQKGMNIEAKVNLLVKTALQKSKKAIALLNRAKKGQSPLKA